MNEEIQTFSLFKMDFMTFKGPQGNSHSKNDIFISHCKSCKSRRHFIANCISVATTKKNSYSEDGKSYRMHKIKTSNNIEILCIY